MSREQRRSKRIHPRRLMGKSMRQSFLIFCEGQTEAGYFSSFKKRTKSLNGGNALAVVQEAVTKKNAATNIVDQYWVVFDKDATSDADFRLAIQIALNNNIHPIWSNQSFELWFILHFRNFAQACHRNQYQRILRNHIPDYNSADKSSEQGKQLYIRTRALIEFAISNAIEAYESFNVPDEHRESSTTVYKLINAILANS